MVQVAEELAQIGDVGLGVELEGARVGQELGKLTGAALAQLCDGHLLLLFQNEAILLLGVLGLEALPGQRALEEVDQHVADGLQVVAATLLDAQMVVDGRITRRARQRTAISVGNVLKILRMAIAFG